MGFNEPRREEVVRSHTSFETFCATTVSSLSDEQGPLKFSGGKILSFERTRIKAGGSKLSPYLQGVSHLHCVPVHTGQEPTPPSIAFQQIEQKG